MIQALLLISAFLLGLPAHANLLNGKPTLPSCAFLDKRALPDECQNVVSQKDLDSILPVISRIVQDEQLHQLRDYTRQRMVAELDEPIRARKLLLDCLAENRSPDCISRIELLRQSLEANMRQLRIVLALSRMPTFGEGRKVSPRVQFPDSLGGRLPPLSRAELKFATDFQNRTLASLERIGLNRLRAELGYTESDSELKTRCARPAAAFSVLCQRIGEIQARSFKQFRGSMKKISESMISDLPLTLRFPKLPITNQMLRKELKASHKTLVDWRTATMKTGGREDRERIYDDLPFVDEFVAKHPDFCKAAEGEIRRISLKRLGSTALKIGGNVAFMTLLCSAASPLVCMAVGGGMAAYGVSHKYFELQKMRERLSSADRENPQASQALASNRFRDFVVTAAFSAAGTAIGVAGSGAVKETALQTMASELEKKSGSLFSETGAAFEEISKGIKDGLIQSAATSSSKSVIMKATEEKPQGNYLDWLASDSLTARLYVSFLRSQRGQ